MDVTDVRFFRGCSYFPNVYLCSSNEGSFPCIHQWGSRRRPSHGFPRDDQHSTSSCQVRLSLILLCGHQLTESILRRSSSPSSILGATQPVLSSVSSILRDVQAFESSPPSQAPPINPADLQALKERASSSLKSLTNAVKEFATSQGLSPVGLVDGAVSDLSASVVGLFKLLGVKRTDKGVDFKSVTVKEAIGEESFGTNGGEPTSYSFNNSNHPFGRSGSRQSSGSVSGMSTYDEPEDSPAVAQVALKRAMLLSDGNPGNRLTSTSSVGSAFDLERKTSSVRAERNGGGGNSAAFGQVLIEQEDENEEEVEVDEDKAWEELKVPAPSPLAFRLFVVPLITPCLASVSTAILGNPIRRAYPIHPDPSDLHPNRRDDDRPSRTHVLRDRRRL